MNLHNFAELPLDDWQKYPKLLPSLWQDFQRHAAFLLLQIQIQPKKSFFWAAESRTHTAESSKENMFNVSGRTLPRAKNTLIFGSRNGEIRWRNEYLNRVGNQWTTFSGKIQMKLILLLFLLTSRLYDAETQARILGQKDTLLSRNNLP
jgi:hypothetical protein